MASGSSTTTTLLEIGDGVVWKEDEEFRFGEVYMVEDFEFTDSTKGRYVGVESKDGKPKSKLGTTSLHLFSQEFARHERDYMNNGER